MTSCNDRLFVCGLLLSIFCITLGFAAPQGSSQPNGTSCKTSNNEQGTCIELKRCTSYTAKKLPQAAENITFVDNNRCGWNSNNEPKICCANSPSLPISESNSFKLRASTTKPADCGKFKFNSAKTLGLRPAQLGSWPWMVALGYRKWSDPTITYRCGASLIADEWLLTAAHCVGDTGSFQLESARLGDLDLNNTVEDGATPVDVPINRTHVHPEYQNDKRNNDIALVRLNKPVEFTPLIRPVCLFSGDKFQKDEFYARKSPYAISWGMTEDRIIPTALRELVVNVQRLEQCSEKYSKHGGKSFTENILCAGESGSGFCQGDAGSPLLFVNATEARFYLGGVSSAGRGCANEYPTLYMKVAKFIPWINEVTGLDF